MERKGQKGNSRWIRRKHKGISNLATVWGSGQGLPRRQKFLPENLQAEKEEKTQRELAAIRLQVLAKDEEDDPEIKDEQDPISEENE